MKRGLRISLRILIVVLVSILALEAGLRMVASMTHGERGLEFDGELGWRMQPNLVKVGKLWSKSVPATTNAAGWRDTEFVRAKTPGVRRIVAVGDSFTFGVGVDHGERFTEYLEKTVPNLEVLNFGANAFGPDQELRLLETEALGYAPDLVLVQLFLGNDLDDVRFERRFGWPRPWFELRGGELHLHKPECTWEVSLRTSSYLSEALFQVAGRWFSQETYAPVWNEESDTVPLLAAIASRVQRAASAAGARSLFVVGVPDWLLTNPPPAIIEQVVGALTRAGCLVLDLSPTLGGLMAKSSATFLPDGHWSPATHAIVADLIRREIEQLNLLPK